MLSLNNGDIGKDPRSAIAKGGIIRRKQFGLKLNGDDRKTGIDFETYWQYTF
jgi:hypothetical protein